MMGGSRRLNFRNWNRNRGFLSLNMPPTLHRCTVPNTSSNTNNTEMETETETGTLRHGSSNSKILPSSGGGNQFVLTKVSRSYLLQLKCRGRGTGVTTMVMVTLVAPITKHNASSTHPSSSSMGYRHHISSQTQCHNNHSIHH